MSGKHSRGIGRLSVILILLVIAAVFALRFISLGQATQTISIASVQAAEGKPVEVTRSVRGDLENWITVAGTVEGIVQYPIISNNALRVLEIPVREGDAVRPGDVVVQLAREAPTPMVHSYPKARAAYENALREVRRLRNLLAEGAISQQALDQAETQLEVAEAGLREAEDTRALVASEAGIVSRILIDEGETTRSGQALLWITRTDSVKVCFEAGSQQALALRTGQRAVWSAPAGGLGGEGRIERVDLMADPQTHLLQGEALFRNPTGVLVPGLLISVRVQTAFGPDVDILPVECLVWTPAGPAVYTVHSRPDGAHEARLTSVDIGLRSTDAVEIRGGLSPGAEVVRYGQSKLRTGDRIRVVTSGEES